MKKYDSYKDSGIEWIGEVPSHWEVKRLKDLVTKIGSGVTPSGGASVYQLSGIPLLRSQNIHFDGLSLDDVAFISKETHDSMSNSKVSVGDVLLNITGASIGRAYFVEDWLIEANVNQHVCILRPNQNIQSKYLYFILRSNIGQEQISREQTGSGREGLNFEALKNFLIPYIEIAEQTAIASYLDRKTAEIDQLIADKKRLITLYEEEKTALINQAVTKGINPEVKMKDSGIEWLGEVPEHWEVKKIFYIAKVNSGGTPDRSNSDYWKGSIPWVKTGEVNYNVIKSTEEHITEDGLKASSAKIAPVGTLLMAMYGQGNTRGRVALLGVPATYNQACCAMIFKEMMDSRFAFFYFKAAYQHIRDDGNETSQMNISTGYISSLRMPVPPISEQYQIIEHIELGISIVDSKIAKTQKLIDLLSEYRTALISEVVTGKIKVIE